MKIRNSWSMMHRRKPKNSTKKKKVRKNKGLENYSKYKGKIENNKELYRLNLFEKKILFIL